MEDDKLFTMVGNSLELEEAHKKYYHLLDEMARSSSYVIPTTSITSSEFGGTYIDTTDSAKSVTVTEPEPIKTYLFVVLSTVDGSEFFGVNVELGYTGHRHKNKGEVVEECHNFIDFLKEEEMVENNCKIDFKFLT